MTVVTSRDPVAILLLYRCLRQYSESQRYDQTYENAKEYQSQKYQSRDYFNQSNNSNKSVSTSILYFKSISQNDINRNQRSFLNLEQNVNDYTSRSDSLRDISSKNNSLSTSDQIRSNWTSRSIQFSLRSNEFDRRNDEYKSKIYNMNMKDSEFDEENLHEKIYEKDCSKSHENDHDTNMSINFAEFDDQRNELYYDEITVNLEEKYETFARFVSIEAFCIKCKKTFLFRNKLHKHLKKNCQMIESTKSMHEKLVKSTDIKNTETFTMTRSIIVKFTAFTSNKEYDLAFRKWNYAEVLIKLRSNLKEDFVCLNTETEALLTNKQFVLKRLSSTHIHLMTSSLTIRDIDSNVHEIEKYVNFSIYLSSKDDSIRLIEIHRKMHLVKELKTNMLIKNDILESKEIIIDVQIKKAIIRNCENIIIEVKIHQRKSFIRKNVVNQFAILISLDFYVKILYKIKDLLTNRDFLFESSSEVLIFIFVHIIDARIIEIMIRNESKRIMKISKNFKLDVTQKIQYENCFYASQEHHLTLQLFKKNHMNETLTIDTTINRSRSSSKNSKIRIFADDIDEKFEKKIFFEVIVFEDESEKQKFDRLINEFSKIWKDERFIDVSKEQWMRLSLKKEWQDKMTVKTKIYSLRIDDKKVINDIFNRLQTQSRLKFIIEATFFNYSIFVMWIVKNDVRKDKAIVDIKELNALLMSNVYSVLSQSEIIDDLLECNYFVNSWRQCILLSMKSSFEKRLQTDSRDSSRTENLFHSHHEQSKFDNVCSTTDEYSAE